MKILKYAIIIFLTFQIQILSQSGWRADLRVVSENYIQNTEVNVLMIVDLYYNGVKVSPQSNYKFEWFRHLPLVPNSGWELRSTYFGNPENGTHTYQDPNQVPEGLIDFYCKVTVPNENPIFTEVITVPWYSIVPNQLKNNGGSFGSVEYWDGSSFQNNNGLSTMYFPREEPILIKADINVVSSPQEKYYNWFGNGSQSYYNNFVEFNSTDLLNTPMTAQFKYIKNASVRGKVDNYFAGTVSLVDPWYRDFTQNPYGLRNRGLSAIPESIENFDINIGISTTHQGIFLNQGYEPVNQTWTPPYYSVKVDAVQDVNLLNTGVSTLPGRSHKFYFRNWSRNIINGIPSAEFQDSLALLTPVVFKYEDAVVSAKLKGTQLSDQTNAYINNNQRKYVKTDDGWLHMVYESMGSNKFR